jgi:acyl-CoA reductase-like NAD-dependent aldehyde dehydrogenase
MTATQSSPLLGLLGGVGTGEPSEIPSIYTAEGAAPAAAGETFANHDPSSEALLCRLSRGREADVDRAVVSATEALHGPWGDMTPEARGRLLMQLADLVEAHADRLARLETLDMGKPLSSSRGDVRGVCATLRYNAGWADKLQGITLPLGPDFVDYVELEPLGVTAHITPWNYPLGMAMRSAAPALAAGCTVVLKPAEQSSLTTLALAEIARLAGLPAGVVNVVTGFGAEAGAALAGHDGIDGVTFTGSVATGRKVGEAAGRNLKPAVLELGGKNPLLVFDDADLDRAVETALDAAFDNCGQVCSSVSRLVLQDGIHDAFLERFIAGARKVTVARGLDDAAIGPLVSEAQHRKVLGHIAGAKADGARLLLGGGVPAGFEKGWFVEPTVLAGVDPLSDIATQETFGPVVTAFRFETEAEALHLANHLAYGLVAGVFTRDIDRALRLSRQMEAGSVWINGWFIGGVQAPTGGVKASGVGRERGQQGILNYTSMKTVGIRVQR